MMNKIKYSGLLMVFSVLCSCTLLDTTPQDFLSSKNYFENGDQLDHALTGTYEILTDPHMYSTNYISTLGVEADEGYHRSTTLVSGAQVYSFGPSDTAVGNLWQRLYEGIGRANTVLANIDTPVMDETRRGEIKGQALFLRAYYYFLLVIHWGDVPLLTRPTTSSEGNSVPRTASKTVYEQITQDLKDAENIVPLITDLGYGGRANRSAVQGLLARVYLHWAGYPIRDESKYANARYWALKVIESDENHELVPDFKEVFINYAADKYDIRESLFEVEFWGNLLDNYHAVGRVGNVNGVQSGNEEIGHAYGYIRATPKLYNLYDENDLRRDWSICPYRYDADGEKVDEPIIRARSAGKFRREYETCLPRHRLGTPQNFPILRYSDVLLMFAEADNEVFRGPSAASLEAINQVKRRAFGVDPKTPDPTIDETEMSYEDFRKYIIDERARELCFEAWRKYDLIRWGILITEMRSVLTDLPLSASYRMAFENVTERHLLFPIPTRELGLNRLLKQNNGW